MKKLLATLTSISTIGSIMPSIMANSPILVKEEKTIENNNKFNSYETNNTKILSLNDYLEFNNKYIKK